jgi:hypothetical protein
MARQQERFRPRLEQLEDRMAPAAVTLPVTTTPPAVTVPACTNAAAPHPATGLNTASSASGVVQPCEVV